MQISWVDVAIEVAFGVGAALFFGSQIAKRVRQQQGVSLPSAMDGSFSLLGGKMMKK
jgi:hypothetical protein